MYKLDLNNNDDIHNKVLTKLSSLKTPEVDEYHDAFVNNKYDHNVENALQELMEKAVDSKIRKFNNDVMTKYNGHLQYSNGDRTVTTFELNFQSEDDFTLFLLNEL